jgi:hypothetical protein
MKIVLTQTGSKDDLGPVGCCFCRRRFHLGPATCWAISEKSNILMGEVCPVCVEAGAARMEDRLERRAMWSALEAEQDAEIAEEGITDLPTVDELLAAETFYGGPMFETAKEYDDAVGRGDVPL